ncbi:hypothetical protein [Siccirubricoccus phaeus]|uniref:hypothetical protein n=1 Tax=Siccirubricoccus phaeus TaxID=2595053 RepID=UPI0011F1F927|nr:hypothetical protein [Siccirubricoccus phaeus]
MTYLSAITLVHTALSLVAILVGVPAVAGLFRPGGAPAARSAFLWTAGLTSVTGFMFPDLSVTPAVITGVVALLILAATLIAARSAGPSAPARRVFAAGMVASLYLLVFVGIAQAFQKIPALHALAPTGSEPAFAVAQLAALAGFVLLGVRATRAARPALA